MFEKYVFENISFSTTIPSSITLLSMCVITISAFKFTICDVYCHFAVACFVDMLSAALAAFSAISSNSNDQISKNEVQKLVS